MRKACKTAIKVVGIVLTLSSLEKNEAETGCCSNSLSADMCWSDIPGALSKSANECYKKTCEIY